jgi:hypothetical protein
VRKVEQVEWDREVRGNRWESMRAIAGCLRTETEPRLYFRPWELRSEERVRVERQREMVEEEIRREMEMEKGEGGKAEREEETMKHGDTIVQHHTFDEPAANGSSSGNIPAEDARAPQDMEMEEGGPPDTTKAEEAKDLPEPVMQSEPAEDMPKEDEHHGEELVEGQEDDVIY